MSLHAEPARLEAGNTVSPLYNDTVRSFSWKSISAVLPATKKAPEKALLSHISGRADAGELVAIMGPSGSGKTTLLNRLAHRSMPTKARLSGEIAINERPIATSDIRNESSYVEQEDHLIGSITASETLYFAAKLGLRNKAELQQRIDGLLRSFGLSERKDVIVGTPIQKGLSGGQKRRVSVASQLITAPKILFLDEPTSGLDSVAAYEVVSYLRAVARRDNLLIIASIHQPSTKTFNLFDQVHLLSRGSLCYGGPLSEIQTHFSSIGFPMPEHINPAEWILELGESYARLETIVTAWKNRVDVQNERDEKHARSAGLELVPPTPRGMAGTLMQPIHLLHRNWLKSYRDLIAYWIRVAMYICLAILMGTCWLRLGTSQDDIAPRLTALFFSGAFLSFMAVAYIPAYIEDQATYFKERSNGLYGPLTFLSANFLIGVPYIFIIVISFSVIAYWLVGFWPTAQGFWTFVGFLILDLLAAESLVVLVASVIPNFVVSLALVAFANGLWMCVNGFLVPETVLNVFWRSWVTKIDYQNWTFRAVMWNEFHATTFTCGQFCAFASPDGKRIPGTSVLSYYGYDSNNNLGAYAAYMIAIVVVYRLLAYGALAIRR